MVKDAAAASMAGTRIDVAGLLPGEYAVSVIHDENDNRKLDRNFVGIPTEGIGFSRNPVLAFGPPSFKSSEFAAVSGDTSATIRMKYFL